MGAQLFTAMPGTNEKQVGRGNRAKDARTTINKEIPSILSSNTRARRSVQSSSLLVNLPPLPKPSPPNASVVYSIHILQTDTISAARELHLLAPNAKVAILNMASPLRPGGGVLTGATSQEEFLCTRSTLLPSLKDEFYRLPELGAVWTPDCLVFRDVEGNNLSKADRFYVGVVTASMLRFPELKGGKNGPKSTWANEQDLELVLEKMRVVMRAVSSKGIQWVVLGAWGCGAYGNPVKEIARAWRIVLLGNKRGRKEEWKGVEQVVFAITDRHMANIFSDVFADALVPDTTGPSSADVEE
jgi:uncharacterized protein (TIGR02452 family)